MHKKLPKIFIFIDKYNREIFKNKNLNIGIVYRNYNDENRENQLIKIANKHKKPVFIDPKGDNFNCYKNAFAITPNLKEFENIVGPCKDHNEIVKKAKNLSKKLNINSILVTLGSNGMILIQKNLLALY